MILLMITPPNLEKVGGLLIPGFDTTPSCAGLDRHYRLFVTSTAAEPIEYRGLNGELLVASLVFETADEAKAWVEADIRQRQQLLTAEAHHV